MGRTKEHLRVATWKKHRGIEYRQRGRCAKVRRHVGARVNFVRCHVIARVRIGCVCHFSNYNTCFERRQVPANDVLVFGGLPAGEPIGLRAIGVRVRVESRLTSILAGNLPAAKAAFMAESQVLISADSFTSPVKTPAWKSKPAWYMVAISDRSINPGLERMMAKRANAKTVEVDSSHVAYMSYPKETAKAY